MLRVVNHQGNANQNHNKILLYITRIAIIKKIIVVGEDVETLEPSDIAGVK